MNKNILIKLVKCSFLVFIVALSCQPGTVLIAPAAIPTVTTYSQTAMPSITPAAAALTGAIYYVDSANGSNSNPGTLSQPWRTIQKAADTMNPGDTCIVLPGDYDERVQVTVSGTSDAPITYRAQETVTMKGFTVGGPGGIGAVDYVTIMGFNIGTDSCHWRDGYGIFVHGSHCIIEDNFVSGCRRGGVVLFANPKNSASTSNNVIRNNRFYRNVNAGIDVAGRDSLIENNEIWETVQWTTECPSPGWPDTDINGIWFFGAGHVIRGNYVHDITNDDPQARDAHIDCFQTWGPASDIVFEQNFCHSPDDGRQGVMTEAREGSVTNLLFRNNIFKAFIPLNIWNSDGVRIVNNVFIGDLTYTTHDADCIQLHSSPNAIVKNNIFYDVGSKYDWVSSGASYIHVDQASGLEAGYNNACRSDGQQLHGSPHPHDLWQIDPRFVNAADDDFHLQSDSHCIDAGTALPEVAYDYDGISRPQGAGYDIGAFEYIQTVSELIIDNVDSGFSPVFSQDAWKEYVALGGQHYGDSHHFNHQIGTGEDIATWTFVVPRAGQYAVYAWWWEGHWRSTDVPYMIHHLGGSTIVRVNQQANGGQWNLLGTFGFQEHSSVTVSDDTASGQDVVADAIRVVYLGPLTPAGPWGIYLPLVIR